MSKEIKIGDKAPTFDAVTDQGSRASLAAHKGKNVVLYFYPKDDTPGCTKQACGFRDLGRDFAKANTVVIGVSRDSAKSHGKFREKYGLDFPLAADEDGAISDAFGTWVKKSMYGREYMGMERATYLIDAKGVVRGIWRNVKVPGHMEEVLAAAKAL